MKTYALRREDPHAVLDRLTQSAIRPDIVDTAYEVFVKSLIIALDRCAAEPVTIKVHDFADLERYKAETISRDKKYLCFDSQSSLGMPFGVSCRFDLVSGEQFGITSRPGYDELADQINRFISTEGKMFGIIEDDIYTGGTLRHMIKLLQDHGVSVHSIISGISSTRHIDGLPVLAGAYYTPDELLEVTDPRDYIFGAKNGGLVVSYRGQKCRVPYCLPFSDVIERSSIAADREKEFSHLIIDANLVLHKALGSLSFPAVLFYPLSVLEYVGLEAGASLKDTFVHLQRIVEV